MICPHCAFPNELGGDTCGKCKRPLRGPAADASVPGDPPGWLTQPQTDPGPRPAAGKPDPAHLARKALDEAQQWERQGDLRQAFVTCQAVLIDHSGLIPEDLLAELHLALGRISIAQGKPQRARKYLERAAALVPNLPGLLEVQPTEPPPLLEPVEMVAELEGDRSEPSEAPNEPVDASCAQPAWAQTGAGRRVWTATFWLRSLALGIDLMLVTALLAGMVGLASLVLGLDGAALAQILAGGFGHLIAFTGLFVLLLLIYVTVFARIGGQTLGKMLLGIRVVRLDGHSVTGLQALLRALGMLVAGLPGLAGFLWAAFDLQRRGWHDRVAGTMVIRLLPPRSVLTSVGPAATASQES